MEALRPITSRLSARLRRLSPFDDAVEVIDIDGPTHWDLEPIIALPDELDRLVQHSSNSTPERNIRLLNARTLDQGPCRMHRLQDAVIADGTVLTKRSYKAVNEQRRRWLLNGELDLIDEGALCSTWVTEHYFAHWLHDGLPHELLAIGNGSTPLVLSGVNRFHEPGYRNLVALPAHPVELAAIKNLWLLEDWEFGRHRAARLDKLVQRIRAHFPEEGPECVFISRGKTVTARTLVNEAEIVEELARRGFAILQPDVLTPDQIVRGLMNARIVVGVEGSALGHALMSVRSGAGFMMIMGPQHFNIHYRPYAAGRGIRLAYTIGDVVDDETFTQPVDRLLKTIDLLDSALGH